MIRFLFLLAVACDATDLERMIDQRRVDPFAATTLFADGRAMRTPPPGTVARDVFALTRLTTTPPAGAAAVSFTVPTDDPPAVTVDGLSDSVESFGAAGGGGGGWGAAFAVSAAVLLAPP